jgi:muramoyltetrapeptide carboxypeptidase
MKRNDFLRTLLPAALAGTVPFSVAAADPNNHPVIIPPYLSTGSRIGIVAASGAITETELAPCLRKLTEWGYEFRISDTVGKQWNGFAGTDAERLQALQSMLDDPELDAILCARGGYGLIRIIDQLRFTRFRKKPKWVIGFSDVTVLHAQLNSVVGVASLHSKMCNSFPEDWLAAEPEQRQSIEQIQQCLSGQKMEYRSPAHPMNKLGKATGKLVGGNMKTLEALLHSRSDLQTDHCILFLEDTGEYAYSIDRLFWTFQRAGKLDRINGLIVGGFKVKKDEDADGFSLSVPEIVLEKLADCPFPVCFDFPVGHQKHNLPLKCGVSHRLEVTETGVSLQSLP